MSPQEAERRLIRLLQGAHAGELAAAHAYAGHARSVRDADERESIERIRLEELDHRERVARILAALGAEPSPFRERVFRTIGTVLGASCHVTGWFAPMYGAGRLERSNIVEYEDAARLAQTAGHPEFLDDLLDMAEVEWDHELYFREKAASHWLWRWTPGWDAPPPRESIREGGTRGASAQGRVGEGPRPSPR